MSVKAARTVLLADACWDALLGLLLLAAGVDGVYEALGLPEPGSPAVVQICSLPLFIFSVVLWRAAGDERLAPVVSRVAALANFTAVPLAVALPLVLDGFAASGVALILATGAVCGLFATLQTRIASQPRGRATA